MNYGYITNSLAENMAVKICNCLGGNENGVDLIIETACAETGLGNIKDNTKNAGMGLTQFDSYPFYDIKQRSARFRDKILNDLGIDINLVTWEHLRYNPYLSLLFTRLFYLLIRENIPGTVEQRAHYWKKYYNTYKGKGTCEHYIEMVRKYR